MNRLATFRRRRFRGLGAPLPDNMLPLEDGSVIDTTTGYLYNVNDKGELFGPIGASGIAPAGTGDNPALPTEGTTGPVGSQQTSDGSTLVVVPDYLQTPRTQPTQKPSSSWDNFTAWLGQPVAKGWPSNGIVIAGAAIVAGLFSIGGKRRR